MHGVGKNENTCRKIKKSTTKAVAHKIIRFEQKLFREDEETLDYSDYDEPEAAALMRVEILDEEEKTGPTLGRVLGA